MISRDTRLSRMPLWFIDTPSDTEMVVNGTGDARRRRHAEPGRVGLRAERHRAGRVFALRADDARLTACRDHRRRGRGAQEGAVRRAVEAVGDQARAQFGLGVGHVISRQLWIRVVSARRPMKPAAPVLTVRGAGAMPDSVHEAPAWAERSALRHHRRMIPLSILDLAPIVEGGDATQSLQHASIWRNTPKTGAIVASGSPNTTTWTASRAPRPRFWWATSPAAPRRFASAPAG